jgi:AraC-like DNA-binding protein
LSLAIPIYRDHGEIYHADTCRPLVAAAAARSVQLVALSRGHYPGRKLPTHALRGVKALGYWNAVNNQPWGLHWHRNEGLEFTFLENGSLGFGVDHQERVLQPDDLTITRPWQLHRVGNPRVGASRLHWLIIDVSVRRPNQSWHWPSWFLLNKTEKDELTHFLRNNEQSVWRASPEIRRCFQSIADAVKTERNGTLMTHLAIRINDMFVMLLDLLRSQKIRLDQSLSGSRRTVQLFLEDLAAHPEHLALDWTVGEMARTCGLGISQFVHHVNQLTNLPPVHYLNHCRLNHSARLLRERPTENITNIAFACGFSSSQYFSTLFSKRFGTSPKEFRHEIPTEGTYDKVGPRPGVT